MNAGMYYYYLSNVRCADRVKSHACIRPYIRFALVSFFKLSVIIVVSFVFVDLIVY